MARTQSHARVPTLTCSLSKVRMIVVPSGNEFREREERERERERGDEEFPESVN